MKNKLLKCTQVHNNYTDDDSKGNRKPWQPPHTTQNMTTSTHNMKSKNPDNLPPSITVSRSGTPPIPAVPWCWTPPVARCWTPSVPGAWAAPLTWSRSAPFSGLRRWWWWLRTTSWANSAPREQKRKRKKLYHCLSWKDTVQQKGTYKWMGPWYISHQYLTVQAAIPVQTVPDSPLSKPWGRKHFSTKPEQNKNLGHQNWWWHQTFVYNNQTPQGNVKEEGIPGLDLLHLRFNLLRYRCLRFPDCFHGCWYLLLSNVHGLNLRLNNGILGVIDSEITQTIQTPTTI